MGEPTETTAQLQQRIDEEGRWAKLDKDRGDLVCAHLGGVEDLRNLCLPVYQERDALRERVAQLEADAAQPPPTHTIEAHRFEDPAEADELFIRGAAVVHLERMSNTCAVAVIDGRDRVTFWVKGRRLMMRLERGG